MKFYIFLPFARKHVVKRLRFRTLKSRNFFENIMLMDWGSFKLISFPSCACCSAARCSARFQILAGNLGERAGIRVTWFPTRSQSPLRSLDPWRLLKSFKKLFIAVWGNFIVTQHILFSLLPVRCFFFILIESHSEQKRHFKVRTAWPAFYLDLTTTGLLNRTKFNFNRLVLRGEKIETSLRHSNWVRPVHLNNVHFWYGWTGYYQIYIHIWMTIEEGLLPPDVGFLKWAVSVYF